MQIRQVETLTGQSAQTIRYYEREGLLCPERNPENGYRTYTESDVRRLEAIAFCRSMNIPISAIRQLLAGDRSFRQCVEDALEDAQARAAEENRVAELCRTVLSRMEDQPELPAEECVQRALKQPQVRALYEQVVPRSARKPAGKRTYLLVIPAVAAILVGLVVVFVIANAASFRGKRNEIINWVTDNAVALTFQYGEHTVSGETEEAEYLRARLGDLLLQPTAAEALPGKAPVDGRTLTVGLDGADADARLILREMDRGVFLHWTGPKGEYQRCLEDRACRTILRQMLESLTP